MIRVGTAGWSYPDWVGPVYPRAAGRGFQPLAFLAGFVDCLEINSTFYGLPEAASAERWSRAVEGREGFRFLAKVHRDLTHGGVQGREAEALVARQREGLEPLRAAGRLAALLVQFPAGFRCDHEGLQRVEFLAELLAGPPLVLEVRHRSWFAPEGVAALRRQGLSTAHIDLPRAADHPPDDLPSTGPLGYLRLHGRNREQWFRRGAGRDDRYDYLYGPRELSELAERARRIAGEHDDTYVVTNNHFAGKALANALELKHLLQGEAPAAPPELLAAFPWLRTIATPTGQAELF